MLDDHVFIGKLNRISKKNSLVLPFLRDEEQPSSEFLEDWGRFLEMCVKEDIPLSDPRWQRVAVQANTPYTRFQLEGGGDAMPDPDFRVGLQLLMSILGRDEEEHA